MLGLSPFIFTTFDLVVLATAALSAALLVRRVVQRLRPVPTRPAAVTLADITRRFS